MRRIIRGIGKALRMIANSFIFCLVVIFAIFRFANAICSYYSISKDCFEFYVVQIITAIFFILLYYLLAVLLICISNWIKRHV